MANIHTVDINRLKHGEVNLGTSIMAVQFNGGVVIGADTRTTTGAYIANRVTDKLTHIHDRVYCCRSGSAADTQAVADAVHQHCQVYTSVYGHAPPVATVATLFEKLCYENKDQLSAGIIVAGWDEEGGGVFNIPLGGGIFQQPWAIGGSGSTYVYGYCDATYKEGMNEEETIEFVRNIIDANGSCFTTLSAASRLEPSLIAALALAMARDGSSGGCIRMCVITKDKVERHFVPGNELPRFWEGKEVVAQNAGGPFKASAVAA